MSEYGEQKGLQEILEELAAFCLLNFAKADNIRVILPQKAIDAHTSQFSAKERVVLTGQPPKEDATIQAHHVSRGCIWLHSIEKNEKAIKELV